MLLFIHILQAVTLLLAAAALAAWAWTEMLETRRSEETYRRETARARRQLIALVGKEATEELMGKESA